MLANIHIHDAKFKLHQQRFLNVPYINIQTNDFWVIVGSNNSGKSAFALAMQGVIPLYSGEYQNTFDNIANLSFEKQQKIIEQTFNNRNNDFVDPDDFGLTAREIILGQTTNSEELCTYYAKQLKITALLDRPFIQLSTGESRKVLLCQALVTAPELLILDEPFEGLDKASVQDWLTLFTQLQHQMALILIVNRLNDIPAQASHIAILDNCQLVLAGSHQEITQHPIFQQLQYAENAINVQLPESSTPVIQLTPNQNPFELENVTVQYGEQKILENLTWTVSPKQHWWIKGPNGAGKSTLLSLITGDHPQAYSNKVILFGKQRGSGETIWEIKQNIGYVSSQLHMDYRVNTSVINVIISGFFDSIGVYQTIPEALRIKALQWLERLNLTQFAQQPFHSLSWGQQRLLLITRAMVKHPPILILDEPLQGLDGINRKLVKQFIEQLVNNSQTQLLFVSHQDQDAPNCISHIFEFVLENGKYVYRQSAV